MKFTTSFHYAGVCTLIIIMSVVLLSSAVMGEETPLIIGLQDTTTSFDPAKVRELVTRAVLHHLYETLVTFEGDDFSQPIPQLAESWEISKDGKLWIFHLRQGVFFSNGNPVDADAVVFSLRRMLTIAGQSVWLLTQFGVTTDSITKIDADTIQIALGQSYAPALFLACLSNGAMSILDPEAVMAHEQEGDMGSVWLDTHSAGSGRFVLEERQPGESFVLRANEHHWQGAPIVQKAIVKHIPEPFEQTIALEQGDIDVAWNVGLEQVKRLEENQDVNIYTTPTLRIRYIGMNLGYEPLAKSDVRDAIRYAIDYEGMIEFILQGGASKIQSFIPMGVPGYNASMPYAQDREKARQLLAAAGYPDGFDLELACENYTPWIDMALQIKRDLENIGIRVTIKEVPNLGELIGYVFRREYHLYLTEWELDYIDPDANSKSFAHCDSLGDDATIKLIAWISQYVTPEIATLVNQASLERDEDTREDLYRQITDTILDGGPYAILHTPFIHYGVRFEARDFIGIPSPYLTGFPQLR